MRLRIIDIAATSLRIRELISAKRHNADLQSEIAMQEGKLKKLEAQIEEKETVIKNLKKEINRAKEKLAGLTEAILEAKEILEGMCSRVKGLISSGLDRINRAKSHKEKEDAAKASEEQLIRIKTDADEVMTMFLPYDDEEEEKEKADPEKEYDGDERDDM